MKFYLAARYSRNAEMRGVRDVLYAMGHEVTSRWIDLHGGKYPGSFTAEQLNTDPEYCAEIARRDVEDLASADVVVSFTSADNGGKGGRHVEYGLALGLGKQLVIVGPRENVFHTLPQVGWYPDWRHYAGRLAELAAVAKAWTGTPAAHCPTCHTTYPTVSAFDAHRVEKLCTPDGRQLDLGGTDEAHR